MHTLYRKFNYRNIRLDDDAIGQTVGVLKRDGSIKQLRWCGFITRAKAKSKPNAQPVKLVITRVDGKDLAPGETVQGCLLPEGVYAVIHSEVVIINGDRTKAQGI